MEPKIGKEATIFLRKYCLFTCVADRRGKVMMIEVARARVSGITMWQILHFCIEIGQLSFASLRTGYYGAPTGFLACGFGRHTLTCPDGAPYCFVN